MADADAISPGNLRGASLPSDAVIIGYYGFRNLGDEAVLDGLLKLLRQELRMGDVVVVSGDPKNTQDTHGVRAVDWTDAPAVLEAVYNTSLVIVGGGGLLSDQSGFTPELALTRNAGTLPGYLAPALMAESMGIPVVAWGVGVGPFFYEDSRRWMKVFGEAASAISVRTKEDLRELEKLDIPGGSVGGDLAWLVEAASPPSDLKRTLRHLPRPVVAVSARSWGSASLQVFRERALAEGLDAFVSKHGGSVLFVPLQELGDAWDDRLGSQRIANMMSSDEIHHIPPGLSHTQIISVLENCDLSVNMRLHGTILGAIAGAPSISITYDPKVSRMADQLGLGDLCHPADGLSPSRLAGSLEAVWSDLEARKRDLAGRVVAERENTHRSFLEFEKVVAQDARPVPRGPGGTIAEVVFNLSSALFKTQRELDGALEEGGSLRNERDRIQNERDQLQDEIHQLQDEIRQLSGEKEFLESRLEYADQRGDLLQRELTGLRETRAMKMMSRYWMIRARLRRKIQHRAHAPSPPDAAVTEDPAEGESSGSHTRARTLLPASRARTFSDDAVHRRIAESKGLLIMLQTINWYANLFQRPQQLAQAFARLGYTVIYDNSHFGTQPGFHEIEPRLFLFNGDYQTLASFEDSMVWTLVYNWDHTRHYPEGALTVYDWIDELDVFDGHKLDKLHRLHSQAMADAAVVTVSARSLLDRARRERPDAIYLPNAVEFERFADWSKTPPNSPALQKLRSNGNPIAGYYGAIARWMDYELLLEVATQRKDWNFLFIGPNYDRSAKGRRVFTLPNVARLQAQPYGDLPGWLQVFDVALIPFLVNSITESTSPLKLFEYFAGGKPVVASRMPEVIAFPEVRAYETAREMSASLDLALADSKNPNARLVLRQHAQNNSWTVRAEAVIRELKNRSLGVANQPRDLAAGVNGGPDTKE